MSSPSEAPRGREFALIWLLAVALALPASVLAVRAVRDLDVPPSAAFVEFNEPRVAGFADAIDGGAVGVVLLGDSRLRNAVPVDAELETRLSEAVGQDIAVLRIVKDWAIYDDFEPLTESILEAGPDLVIVVDQLRGRARGDEAMELLQRQYLWWKLFGTQPWAAGDPDQHDLQTRPTCAPNDGVADRLVRFNRWFELDDNGATVEGFAMFEDALRGRGIEQRFLAIPVTEAAAAGMPDIAAADPARLLRPNQPITDDHFCDAVHLGESGQEIFTNWFVEEIAELATRRTA